MLVGTYRKIQTLAAQPRTAVGPGRFLRFGISMPKANVVSGRKRGQQRFAPYCPQMCWDRWTLQCFRTKACSSKGFPHHAQSGLLHVTTPTLRVYLSRRNTSIPENTSFEWNGIFTQARQSILAWELLTLCRTRVLDAGSDRDYKSSCACYVGDTRILTL